MTDKERFVAALQDAREYLFRQEQVWAEALENPETILTRLFDPAQAGQGGSAKLDIRTLERAKDEEHGSLYDLFWHKVDSVLAQFFKEHVDQEITLVAEEPDSIPHTFRLEFQGSPILTFSITDHWFRDERPWGNELATKLRRARKDLDDALNAAAEYRTRLSAPHTFGYNCREWLANLTGGLSETECLASILRSVEKVAADARKAVAHYEAAQKAFEDLQPKLEAKWTSLHAWFTAREYAEGMHPNIWRTMQRARMEKEAELRGSRLAEQAEALGNRSRREIEAMDC